MVKGDAQASGPKIPHWLRNYLNADELEKISTAIKTAEQSTAAEIVPLIVRQSSCVGHVQPLLFFMLCLFFMILYESLRIPFVSFHPPTQLGVALVGIVIAYCLANVLQRMPALRRFLTNKLDLDYQVRTRAEAEFHENGLHKTAGATGILIFVSLMERQVVVLADSAISEKLPADTWQNIVKILVTSVHKRQLGQGIRDAIGVCRELVSCHFPAAARNPNELVDKVIIKE